MYVLSSARCSLAPGLTVFVSGLMRQVVFHHSTRITCQHSVCVHRNLVLDWRLLLILCPLHISRSDAPIGLRCSRRQFGTKSSDVASAHHSHWPNGAQCVHSRRLVRESRTILYDSLVGTVKESYLLQLSVALYTFGSRSAGGVGQY